MFDFRRDTAPSVREPRRPTARRLIGLVSLPCGDIYFLTRIYEHKQEEGRTCFAETSIGSAPDDRVVSRASQLDELIKTHLPKIQLATLAVATS
jgi:hypothetical protein